jgi:hypothetical protein
MDIFTSDSKKIYPKIKAVILDDRQTDRQTDRLSERERERNGRCPTHKLFFLTLKRTHKHDIESNRSKCYRFDYSRVVGHKCDI